MSTAPADRRAAPLAVLLLGLVAALAAHAQAPDAAPADAGGEKPAVADEKAAEAPAAADEKAAAADEEPAAAGEKPAEPPFTPKPAPPLPQLDADGGRGRRVVVLPIDGTIDMGLAPFVDRVLEDAKGAAAVILDIDTFGGRVDAAVRIRDALLRTETPIIAYVDNRAISAGALISLAADHIVFAPGASMGAATPVQMQGGQAEAVGEKMVSYMRSEMRATAEANGRPAVLAEAMVDADVAVEGVIAKGKLLTVTTDEAIRLGLAAAKHKDLDALIDALGLSAAERVRPTANWAEKVARFLTDPVVAGLLMSLGMLGLLMEFYTPGFGVVGAIGLLCLLLFFGGSSIAGLAGWEEMLVFALGAGLLAAEIFIIPGFGIAGVAGIALIVVALVMGMIDMPLSTSWEIGALGDAMTVVLLALFVSAVVMVFVIRYLPGSFLGRWLVLEHTLGGSPTGEVPLPGEEWGAAPADQRGYLGRKGVATTELRPAGRVRIGDDVVDVVSRDRWIPRGTPVKVVKVEGVRVVVIEDESVD